MVTGWPAYLIGVLLASTFPLVLVSGFIYGLMNALQGQDVAAIPLGGLLIDVSIVGGVAIASGILAVMYGKDPIQIKKAKLAAEREDRELRPPPDPNNPYAT